MTATKLYSSFRFPLINYCNAEYYAWDLKKVQKDKQVIVIDELAQIAESPSESDGFYNEPVSSIPTPDQKR